MPKYLFIATNEFAWGGSEILWSQAAERLARQGAEVRVSFQGFGKPREPMERVEAAGGKVIYRRPFSVLSRFIRKILPLPNYCTTHIRTVAAGVDLVVISQSSFWEVLPWIESVRDGGLKYAVVVQGATTAMWPDDDSAERLAACFESANCAFFVSQSTLDLCRRQLSTPLSRGRVIRNPFNVRYDAQPAWPKDSLEEIRLACVGRLEVSTKGQDILLDALSLPHWRERRIRVSLVGDGPQERTLRRQAERLRLSCVEFTGHQSDIENVLSKHHALILPSRQEGMPLAVVEAMICGRPCIATDVGGNRELIRDNINGFLAKVPTAEFVDEALNRAWENRGRLREMGERAAADVRLWISSDPAEDFARNLAALVDK